MEKICWKGHAAMFGANAMWGLMSPISKFIMLGGAVTPLGRNRFAYRGRDGALLDNFFFSKTGTCQP